METQKKQMNLGLCLLRVWLSFEVVVDHYWHAKGLCCWLIAQIPGRFSKDLVQ